MTSFYSGKPCVSVMRTCFNKQLKYLEVVLSIQSIPQVIPTMHLYVCIERCNKSKEILQTISEWN